MLVLTRKIGECIKVGEDIWITVLTAERGQARIGITAPRNKPIVRTELLEEERGDAKAT